MAAGRPDLAGLSSSARELVPTVGLEPGNVNSGWHVEAFENLTSSRIAIRLRSLSSPSQMACQSSLSIEVTPVTKRLDSIVRRTAPVWNRSNRGSWHLYGHSHGHLADNRNSLSMDVRVDTHEYRPWHFDEIADLMGKKSEGQKPGRT